MTEKPAELSFAKFMVALRSLRKIGRETPDVDTFALFAFAPVPSCPTTTLPTAATTC